MPRHEVRNIMEAAYDRWCNDAVLHAKTELIERVLELPPKMFRELIATVLTLDAELRLAQAAETTGTEYKPPRWWPEARPDRAGINELLRLPQMSTEQIKEMFSA